MSKARTQPSAKTGLVFKISIALVFLLAVVVYKLNDYFKQEKWFLAQNQLRTQIVSTKTAVSSQLNQLKNILSSYETELSESKINWVQLDPFFGIAKAQKNGSALRITQYIGRSGSVGDRWNSAYLEKALTLRKATNDSPITTQLFRDKQGGKFLAIIFTNAKNSSLVVVGSADYFQKYFDLNRGGKMTSLLKTSDNVLAAHSEADYVATLTDEATLSTKAHLIEKEEIVGTNLIAMNYIAKKGLVSGFVVPWSVVGLISGFGFILIGLLYYGLDPIEKRVERYKKQERDQIFKETLATNLAESNLKDLPAGTLNEASNSAARQVPLAKVTEAISEASRSAKTKEFGYSSEPVDMASRFSSVTIPLQQALFNIERSLSENGILIERHINTTLSYDLPFSGIIRAFETILKSRAEAVRDQIDKRIVIRAYDIEQNMTVIEVKDLGFTSPPSSAAGLALVQAKEIARQARADLTIEKAEPQGVLVKMIIKNLVAAPINLDDLSKKTLPAFSETEKPEVTQEIELQGLDLEDSASAIDLEKALSLDDIDSDGGQEEIKVAMTSKNFKTSDSHPLIQKPHFLLGKKDFKVDEITIKIRRPNTDRVNKA